MTKKHLFYSLIALLLFIFALSISANASTSDALETFYAERAMGLGSGYYAPNVSDSDDFVDVSRGDVVINETDYLIKGRNGMTIPIVRSYNPDRWAGSIFRYRETTYDDVAYMIGYYYINTSNNEKILVGFDDEYEAYEFKDGILGNDHRNLVLFEDCSHDFYSISHLENENGNYTYELDTTTPPVIITEESKIEFICQSLCYNDQYVNLGSGWAIPKLSAVYWNDRILGDYYEYSVTFCDIYGKYTNMEITLKEDDEGKETFNSFECLDDHREYSAEYVDESDFTVTATHPEGFVYNMIIKDINGLKYYIHYHWGGADWDIKAVADRYDNTFVYSTSDSSSNEFYSLEDCSSGIIYRVTPTGIYMLAGSDTTELVAYNHQEFTDDSDSADMFLCDNTYKLTVYRNDDESEYAYESDNYVTYNMSPRLLRKQLFNVSEPSEEMSMTARLIDSIEYSNGLIKYYEYDRFNTSANVLEKYFVKKTYEKNNDTEYNKKDYSYGFIYTAPAMGDYWGSGFPGYTGNYRITRTETFDYVSPAVEHQNIVYFFDGYGRLESKWSYCDDERFMLEEHTYDCNCYDAAPANYTVTHDIEEDINVSITTLNTYDDYHRLTKSVYGDTVTEYTYGSNNIVIEKTEIKDPYNNTPVKTVNILTSDKKSIAQTEVYEDFFIHFKESYTYNSDGTLSSKTSYNPSVNGTTNYTYQYNPDGSTIATQTVFGVTDADGENPVNITSQVMTDVFGNIIKNIDGNGNETVYEYDLLSRNTKIRNPDGGVITYEYDDISNIIEITDAENNKERYIFDVWGNCTSHLYCDYNMSWVVTESAEYDYNHRLDKHYRYQNDSNFYWTEYEYDNRDRLVRETAKSYYDDNINTVLYTYTDDSDSDDRPIYITTKQISDEETTFAKNEITKDYLGRTLTQKLIDTEGATRTYSYTQDYFGNVLTVTAPDNSVEMYYYDALGNVISYTNQNDLTCYYTYGFDGSLATATDYNGNTTTYTYDEAGRQIKADIPFEYETTSATKLYYDASGNVTKESVQMEHNEHRTTEYSYDNMNRLSYTTTYPTPTTSEITQYFYDKNGNITHMFPGLSTPLNDISNIPESAQYVSYSYDNRNNCISVGGSLTSYTEYDYDNLGNVTYKSMYDYNVAYERDILGNVITLYENSEPTVFYNYNIIGQRIYMNDSSGTTTYTYDEFGNLTREEKDGILKKNTYDSVGRRTAFNVYYGGTNILSNSYTYDPGGRMTCATSNGETIYYTYDGNGNVLTETIGDYTTETIYNDANLPTMMYQNNNHIYNIFHDYSGNIKTIEDVESLLTLEYTYDSANRLSYESQCNYFDLTSENKMWDYSFNALGNRINMEKSDLTVNDNNYYNYTYDNHNRLQSVAVSKDNQPQHTIVYSWQGGDGDSFATRPSYKEKYNTEDMLAGVEMYDYDIRGRLTELNVFSDTFSFVSGGTYTYDADNLRQTKVSDGKETQFVLDGGDVVAEIITDFGDDTTEIVTYGRGNRLFCRIKNDEASYYFYNPRGDIVKLISETGETETVRYDSYGNFIGEVFTDNPFGYCGEYHDKESGFIYLRNRYYDPSVGRFITEDPARDGLNWYIYANNNPVNYIDPWGLAPTKEEAAAMADHIYDWEKDSARSDRTVAGWRLIDVWRGRESMKMGIYIKDSDDWQNPSEYALVFRGSIIQFNTETIDVWKNNAEQFLSAKSADMWDAINYSVGFTNSHSQEITFIGHSKGGAEALAAAVATGKNAIVFNPAKPNLRDYNLSAGNYKGNATSYVVRGEILNNLFGEPGVGRVEYLNQKYKTPWYFVGDARKIANIVNPIRNHLMEAVLSGI